MKQLQHFTVPQFMLDKMKVFMVSVQGKMAVPFTHIHRGGGGGGGAGGGWRQMSEAIAKILLQCTGRKGP